MEILQVLFLELILCAVLISQEIDAHFPHKPFQPFFLFQNAFIDLLTSKASYFITKSIFNVFCKKCVREGFELLIHFSQA